MSRLLPPSARPATRRPAPDRRKARERDWTVQAGALGALVLAFVAAGAAAGGVFGALSLPAGPSAARGLAADPLALLFASLLLSGLAAGLCTRSGSGARLDLVTRTAAGLLAVFAADPFSRALGVGLTALSWRAGVGRTVSVVGVLCLVLGAVATGAAVSVVLTLLGAGLLIGSAAPFAVELSLYLALRAVAGLASVALPGAFAPWVMVAGACLALAGAGAALASDRLDRTARRLAAATAGLVVVAVGVGLAARGRDLLPLTATSFGAAILLTLAASVGRIGLTAASDLVAERAGSVVLFRLGGLSVRMKLVAAGIAAAMACALPLPPGPGFPGIWLLIQAAGALSRTGGVGLPVLTVAVMAGAALAVGLGAAASLRVLAVAVLGRPRTPRMAGAEDAIGDGRRAMIGVVAAAMLAGLLPALLLRALGPVVAVLSGVPATEPFGLLALIPEADLQGYDAPLLVVLIALGATVATLLVRRGATATEAPAEAPVWDGGLMPSPWLPYGEPGAQVAPRAVQLAIGWALHLPPLIVRAAEGLIRVRAWLAALRGEATPPKAHSIRDAAGALLLIGIALLGVLVLGLSR